MVHLCIGGLVVGAATSVGGPATRAMLADLGDRIGPGVAVRALAWQDLAHRISMVASPPVAAWVVTQHGAMPLMWADTIAVLLAAVLVASVGRYAVRHRSAAAVPRRAREVLRAHPVVADGIAMAAVGWFWWFAFALGLAILGAETGRPGQLVAAGMAGYGIGSLAGSASAPLLVTRLPRVPTMVIGWIVLGATFAALPWVDGSLLTLALVSVGRWLRGPVRARRTERIDHRAHERRRAPDGVRGAARGRQWRCVGGDAHRRRCDRTHRRGNHHACRRSGPDRRATGPGRTNPFPTTPSGLDRSATGGRGSATGGAGRHQQVASNGRAMPDPLEHDAPPLRCGDNDVAHAGLDSSLDREAGSQTAFAP